jgi:Uma2 family endonuclease
MTAIDTRVHTADELLRMKDDGYRYELVRGELVRMSPAGEEHGGIGSTIMLHLGGYVRTHHLGKAYALETGFILSRQPDTVRAPDVAFVRAERVVRTTHFVSGAPDLAVEVISPNDTYTAVDAKIREYLAAGTRAVVIVNPRNNTVRVHRLSGITEVTDVLEVDDVVPGWKMTLEEIFEP